MSIRAASVGVLGVICLTAAACSHTPSRLYPPSINASAAGTKAVEMYDTDKDGKISGAELETCGALKAALLQIDTTGDGAITADEIAARIKQWQESKLGRMSLSCTVLHDGRPLAEAEVKFVPEKFLGDNIQAASGKTDKNGIAMISVPTSGSGDPPGVAPGLYRVEITKAGDNIPAKYNTETILGEEVASNSAGVLAGIKFNLQY